MGFVTGLGAIIVVVGGAAACALAPAATPVIAGVLGAHTIVGAFLAPTP